MKTLSKSLSELAPQQQADLQKVANKQRKTADVLEKFRAKLAKNQEELTKSNSRAAETLQEAKDQLDQHAITGRMRETAEQLGKNNVGRAFEGDVPLRSSVHVMPLAS